MTNNAGVGIALVNEDEKVRSQLVELIQNAGDLKLIGAYESSEAALRGMPSTNPDVVVMDIQLRGIDGVDCMRILKERLPKANFLILTGCETRERLFESLRAGASGYLLKRTSSARLLEAIHEVHEGGSPMTPQIARQVVQYFSDSSKSSRKARGRLARLSPGETKTLNELSQGYAYKVIADHLGISVHGVRNYIRKIYDKLQVHTRTEAVIKYLRQQK